MLWGGPISVNQSTKGANEKINSNGVRFGPLFSTKLQNESQFHRVRRLWGRLFNLRPIVNWPTARVDNGRFMKPTITLAAAILLFFPMHSPAAAAGPYQYPFQNP